MGDQLSWVVAGEGTILVQFASEVSDETLARIQAFRSALHRSNYDWLLDSIPSFTTLLIEYDPLCTDYLFVVKCIRDTQKHLDQQEVDSSSEASVVVLPVYYSEESGLDLEQVALQTQMTIEEVIHRHQETIYRVYAVGFAPGFTYLGQLDAALALPRLKTPRLKVPKGSVAIAERQTAIYPVESPGGWHILGNCPIKLFDAQANPAMSIRVGDKVRFKAISREEFVAIGGQLS